MKAVAGVFRSRADAERALAVAQSAGVPDENIVVLATGDIRQKAGAGSGLATEEPGIKKAEGAELETCGGSPGMPVFCAVIPGVGAITAFGRLGVAVLGVAGAPVEAAAGGELEKATAEALPEDEMFVYEDALRNAATVLIILAEEHGAETLRKLLNANGAASIEDARHRWWMGVRSAEQENYSKLNRSFTQDEKFYRLGFEASLHAKTRCREYDQVMGEMTAKLEDLKREYPNANVEEPFIHGYERGRDYYQGLCNQSTAA
jgi:hypothetical protein